MARLPSDTAAPNLRGTAAALVEAVRPKQWLKNVILFAALIFSRHTFDPPYLAKAVVATALFCLLASTGYLFNDLYDADADRTHPKKRFRPIASGRLSKPLAVAVMVGSGLVSLGGAFALSTGFGFTCAAYLALTVGYTLYIKHLVILDVMGIATLFILRAVAGAGAISVVISPWFLICVAFLSLFLAMNKRLSELLLLEKTATQHRKNLGEYTPQLLERMINIVTAGAIMSYALYTFDAGAHRDQPEWLMLTIPYVLYGIFRYQYLVSRFGEGGAPEETLMSDRPMVINAILYGLTVIIILHTSF